MFPSTASVSGTRGVSAALLAALLFGASTPIAKQLLAGIDPWLFAGLAYLGSGIGLAVLRTARSGIAVRVTASDRKWLAAAIATGGVAAPVLLLYGLSRMPAADVSLLLNAEVVLTAVIAWFVYREGWDRRLVTGVLLIASGAVALTWSAGASFEELLPAAAVLAACLAWAIDNNLTRKVALADPTSIAMMKGLVAGATNTSLALVVGASWPGALHVAAIALLGFVSYGISLMLFIIALRHLGAARTGAYFATAPFVGALLAIPIAQEPVTPRLGIAAALMAAGVWLHLSERHEHKHHHEALEHEHEHEHDEHHLHHGPDSERTPRHTHRHRHESLTHSHRHYPDAHHRHPH